MKVINLTKRESVPAKVYTCNVYLVLGGSNAMEDVNTMVDVGMDPAVIDRVEQAATGVGKKRVAQVILTHNHFDHAGERIRDSRAVIRKPRQTSMVAE